MADTEEPTDHAKATLNENGNVQFSLVPYRTQVQGSFSMFKDLLLDDASLDRLIPLI